MLRLKVQFSSPKVLGDVHLMRPVYIDSRAKYVGDVPRVVEPHPVIRYFRSNRSLLVAISARLEEPMPNLYQISDLIREEVAATGRDSQEVDTFLETLTDCNDLRDALFPTPLGRFVGISLPSQGQPQPFRNLGLIELRCQVQGVCDVCIFQREWQDYPLFGPFCWPPGSNVTLGIVLEVLQEPTGVLAGRVRIFVRP